MDYIKLFKDYKIPTDIQTKGWIQVNCPFCDDKKFNGGLSFNDEFYNCWRCGSKNNVQALSKILNLSPTVIRNEILTKYRGTVSKREQTEHKHVKRLKLPTDTFTEVERRYLIKRGYDPDYLYNKFGVVGGGVTGDFSYRIILPLYVKGKLISWTGRSILSKDRLDELDIPRYKNLSIEKSVSNPKDYFFNMDNATKNSVILVEGPFDVLRMGDDCICSFGTGVKKSQEELLANEYSKIFIAFDDEPEAQKKAYHLGMDLISLGMEVEIVNFCQDYGVNDPDSLTEEQVLEVKEELGF